MDLNIIVSEDGQSPNEEYIRKRILRAYDDRFHTVALSTIIDGEKIKDIPRPLNIKCENCKIRILNRLTVKVSKSMQIFNLQKNETFKKYDILAIEPMNEQVLNHINSGDTQCDILTFTSTDLSKVIKTSNFALSIERNIGIEINYSGLLSSPSLRRQTIAFGQLLVDKTRGKGIILSSGTRPEMMGKTPEDMIAMAFLYGLERNLSKNAIFKMTQTVIKRSELRRNTTTSIIKIEDNQSSDDGPELLKRKQTEDDVIPVKKIKT